MHLCGGYWPLLLTFPLNFPPFELMCATTQSLQSTYVQALYTCSYVHDLALYQLVVYQLLQLS
jgi:hypothetical protein